LIRIGIVGTNYGCQVLLPAFRRDPRCQVVALAGSAPQKTRELASRAGVQPYDTAAELIDQAPVDAVAIATPPGAQPAIAIHALKTGKAVFLEKPLAADWDGAQAVREQVRASGRPVMVDFEFAELPAWRRAKSIIDAGALGALRHVVVTWNVESYSIQSRARNWKTEDGHGGGMLGNLGSHSLHYLEHFCGPIEQLSARLHGLRSADFPTQSSMSFAIDFRSGAAGSVAISAASYLGSGHRLEFYGEEGTLSLINPTSDYVRGFKLMHARRPAAALAPVEVEEFAASSGEDARVAPVARLAARFLDAIETGQAATPGIDEACRVQWLIEAALSSQRLDSRSVRVAES
jgi:predicted dehydrogenase